MNFFFTTSSTSIFMSECTNRDIRSDSNTICEYLSIGQTDQVGHLLIEIGALRIILVLNHPISDWFGRNLVHSLVWWKKDNFVLFVAVEYFFVIKRFDQKYEKSKKGSTFNFVLYCSILPYMIETFCFIEPI